MKGSNDGLDKKGFSYVGGYCRFRLNSWACI